MNGPDHGEPTRAHNFVIAWLSCLVWPNLSQYINNQQVVSHQVSTGGGGENSSKMNKGLCVLLVVCLVVSLIIPDIDAANIKKHRGRVSATRSRSQIRTSKAKAIRQNRRRQSASKFFSPWVHENITYFPLECHMETC